MLAALAIIYPGELVSAVAGKWPLFYSQWPLGVLMIAVVTGLAEEPGWRGFAQPTANRQYQPLIAALVVSLIWAAWHLPNALFGPSLTETATHFVATVVNGFVLAWVYNSTGGSVLLAMLLHGAQNGTNGLVQRLFEGAADSPSTNNLLPCLGIDVRCLDGRRGGPDPRPAGTLTRQCPPNFSRPSH